MLNFDNNRNPKFVLLVASIAWLTICQGVFYAIQTQYAEKTTIALNNQFRSEFYATNDFYHLSNIVADMTKSKYIRCAKLIKKSPLRVVFDVTSFHENCHSPSSFLTLNHVSKSMNIQSINGAEYSFDFQITNTNYFIASLWIMRFLGLLLIYLGYKIVLINNERKKIEVNSYIQLAKAQELISLKLAHDIRSPLSVLNLLSPKIHFESQEVSELFTQSTERINQIANDLLTPATKIKDAKIDDVIQRIMSEKKIILESENINYSFEDNLKEKCFSNIDPSEIARILSNLLNNSIEALSISTKTQRIIKISTEISNSKILIKVYDNGKGIPSSEIDKIGSQRFTFGKESLSNSGSGIGLYAAAEYLKLNNGGLTVQSVEGEFTEITLILPQKK